VGAAPVAPNLSRVTCVVESMSAVTGGVQYTLRIVEVQVIEGSTQWGRISKIDAIDRSSSLNLVEGSTVVLLVTLKGDEHDNWWEIVGIVEHGETQTIGIGTVTNATSPVNTAAVVFVEFPTPPQSLMDVTRFLTQLWAWFSCHFFEQCPKRS